MECTISSVLEKHCADGRSSALTNGSAIEIFSAIDLEQEEIWNQFVGVSNPFLNTSYLEALRQVHDKGLEVRYSFFWKDKKLIGVSAFQIAHFATSADAYSNAVMRFLHKSVQYLKLGHIHNILICGNAIATGEHGFLFDTSLSNSEVASILVRAMKQIATEEKAKGKRICAMVAKDFYPQSAGLPKELNKKGFKAFSVDHNMVLPLLQEWKSLEDYLQSMVTKFRTKAKSALNKSQPLQIEDRIALSNPNELLLLQKLYDNVHYKADFRLGKMSVDVLPLLLEKMPNEFFLRTYSLDGTIVGFMTAMRCGKSLEAHIIGLDYDYNKDYAVYQRILYDYISLGIKLQCQRVVLGRTAAEIKSTIGAFPVDLTCAILHQRKISNALLKMILHYVGPSQYEQRQPYKAEVLREVKELAAR